MPRFTEKFSVFILLAAFSILATGFSLGPIFDAPDELLHYNYARVISTTGRLPEVLKLPAGQYIQAPLYYILVAPITRMADGFEHVPIEASSNPYTFYHTDGGFNIASNDNKNFYLHARSEAFPYTQNPTALAVHLTRLISIILGVLTLLAGTQIFRILWPDHPERRWMALGLMAFWPQFLYLFSYITNDTLLVCLSTVSLWLILHQFQKGPSWVNATLLGLAAGGAILTKVSGLYLAIPIGMVVLLNFKKSWRYAILTLGIVILISGWWFVWNQMQYGDPLALRVNQKLFGHELYPKDSSLPMIVISHAITTYNNVWARFGWLTVAMPDWIYRYFDLLVIASTTGTVLQAIRLMRQPDTWNTHRSLWRTAGILSIFAMTWILFLMSYCVASWFCNQGRYLLPAVSVWVSLFSAGLMFWIPARFHKRFSLTIISASAVVACVSLFGYFLPAYAPSPVPSHIEHPLAIRLGDAAEITGIDPLITRAAPGQMVRIRLMWRAIQPTDTPLTAFLHSAGENVVYRDSYPATGNLLSTDWLPGQTWADDYVVIIPKEAVTQRVYPLLAGLYDHADNDRLLQTTDENGSTITPFVGQVAINAPPDPFEPDYRLGDIIGMAQPQITIEGKAMSVCLRWVSLKETDLDYHIFLHITDEQGNLIDQRDFVPKQGQYPTWGWARGERIEECVEMDTPSGNWQIRLGMYDVATGDRLPITARDGSTLPDGQVIVRP